MATVNDNRIYIATAPYWEKPRLVMTTHRNHVINHLSKPITVRIARAVEVVELVNAGVVIEKIEPRRRKTIEATT